MRVIATSASLALLLGIAACGDDPASDPPPPPPPPTDTDPEDTDPVIPMGEELEFYFSFGTGIDEETHTTSSVTTPEGEVTSYIEIFINTDLWDEDPASTDEYCYLEIEVGNQARASWTDAEGNWFSYDLAPTGNITSTCEDWKYDAAAAIGLSEITITEYFSVLSWAVGIGGTLDPAIQAAIEASPGANIDNFFGGQFDAYFVDPDTGEEFSEWASPTYTQGFQADADLTLLTEGTGLVLHTTSTAQALGGMANGYYLTSSWTYWVVPL